MKQVLGMAVLVALSLSVAGAAGLEEFCKGAQPASSYEHWQFLENNAFRTADAYAVQKDKPEAVTLFGRVSVSIENERVVLTIRQGQSTVQLVPNFDFCEDPSGLSDERPDLFTVIAASHNGVSF